MSEPSAWGDAEWPRPPEEHRGQLRIAERLVHEHGADLRHVHGIGWHVWDGTRWAEDEDDEPRRRVIDTVKTALREAVDLPKTERDDLLADVRKAESSQGVNGVLSLTGSLLPVSVSHKRMDADGWLLNTPGGTVDLRTAEVRPHDRADHLTKCTAAPIGDDHDAEWRAFLAQILPDPDVRAFVQRLMGVALLGEVREQYLPIFTGTGANGKGVLRDVLLHALGDYAAEVDPALLMASKHDRHATFKMQLRGRRLVFTSETEKGRAFAESAMKRLTGGDPVEANKMHRDPITFLPSHTLVMVTNHLPQVSGDDPAVWRRILVVPFTVTIPPEQRDPGLSARLKAAAPAVLRWAFDGWQEYQRIGLCPPLAVRAASDEYRADSDALGRFIDERCLINPHAHIKARDLFTAYTEWCRENVTPVMTEPDFAKSMKARGIEKAKSHGVMKYRGIGLYAADDDAA